MILARFSTCSVALSGFLAILALTPAARADLIYQLTDDGCSGGCGPQVSFGQVDLHPVSATEVEVTVTLFNGNDFITTGNHEALTFNVDDGTATVVPVTAGFTNTTSTDNPPFGTFGYAVACTGCGPGGSSPLPGPLLVDVSRASGLAPSDFIANSGGFFFADDILSGTTGQTGAVAATALAAVPEPSFYVVLVLALAGAVSAVRRERKAPYRE
jgi:hypothetical protein